MSFEPLLWVIGTLTPWHYGVWAAFLGLSIWGGQKNEETMPLPLRLLAGLIIFPVFYGMIAPIVGQVVGDHYNWSQLWPSAFILSGVLSLWFLVPVSFGGTLKKDWGVLAFGLFGFGIATAIFGLFFAGSWWLFPRIIGFGLFDFPKYAWGVQL